MSVDEMFGVWFFSAVHEKLIAGGRVKMEKPADEAACVRQTEQLKIELN